MNTRGEWRVWVMGGMLLLLPVRVSGGLGGQRG
jgi:hypothetical protein